MTGPRFPEVRIVQLDHPLMGCPIQLVMSPTGATDYEAPAQARADVRLGCAVLAYLACHR